MQAKSSRVWSSGLVYARAKGDVADQHASDGRTPIFLQFRDDIIKRVDLPTLDRSSNTRPLDHTRELFACIDLRWRNGFKRLERLDQLFRTTDKPPLVLSALKDSISSFEPPINRPCPPVWPVRPLYRKFSCRVLTPCDRGEAGYCDPRAKKIFKKM